jgi:hypothetical protein
MAIVITGGDLTPNDRILCHMPEGQPQPLPFV